MKQERCPTCHEWAFFADNSLERTALRTLRLEAIRHEVRVSDILSRSRSKKIVVARHAAMRALKDEGLLLKEIGWALSRHYSTVSYALNKAT